MIEGREESVFVFWKKRVINISNVYTVAKICNKESLIATTCPYDTKLVHF